MSSIDIKSVESSRSPYYRQFVHLPFEIYQNNPNWVPWFNRDIKMFIDRRHPLFEHSQGEFFVALKGREVKGRIFVFENTRYNETHKKNIAHFYFNDYIDDAQVAAALFDTAVSWAKKRNLEAVFGPMGMGGLTGSGLLVDGFDQRGAMTMQVYNHPYYVNLIESFGFSKHLDNYSFCMHDDGSVPQPLRDLAKQVLEKGEYKVLQFDSKKDLLKVVDELIRVYTITLAEHPANYFLSDNELAYIKNSLYQIADPNLIKIIAYKGEIIAFVLAFHDLSAALQKSRGRLTPLSIYRIMREYKKTDWVLVNGIGIVPEHQGLGVNAVMYTELEKVIRGTYTRLKNLEMVQIQETTIKMLSNAKTLKGQIRKTHRIYKYTL